MSELALEAKPMGRLTFAKDSLLMFLQDVSERVGYIVCRFETDGAALEAKIISGVGIRAPSSLEKVRRSWKLSWRARSLQS
jgi:hypothetical protein